MDLKKGPQGRNVENCPIGYHHLSHGGAANQLLAPVPHRTPQAPSGRIQMEGSREF